VARGDAHFGWCARGCAHGLPRLRQVSQVDMVSRARRCAETLHCVLRAASRSSERSSAPGAVRLGHGTTVTVSRMFDSMPVRRDLARAAIRSADSLLGVMQAFALRSPHVAFRLVDIDDPSRRTLWSWNPVLTRELAALQLVRHVTAGAQVARGTASGVEVLAADALLPARQGIIHTFVNGVACRGTLTEVELVPLWRAALVDRWREGASSSVDANGGRSARTSGVLLVVHFNVDVHDVVLERASEGRSRVEFRRPEHVLQQCRIALQQCADALHVRIPPAAASSGTNGGVFSAAGAGSPLAGDFADGDGPIDGGLRLFDSWQSAKSGTVSNLPPGISSERKRAALSWLQDSCPRRSRQASDTSLKDTKASLWSGKEPAGRAGSGELASMRLDATTFQGLRVLNQVRLLSPCICTAHNRACRSSASLSRVCNPVLGRAPWCCLSTSMRHTNVSAWSSWRWKCASVRWIDGLRLADTDPSCCCSRRSDPEHGAAGGGSYPPR
jgi:hypothetical protein